MTRRTFPLLAVLALAAPAAAHSGDEDDIVWTWTPPAAVPAPATPAPPPGPSPAPAAALLAGLVALAAGRHLLRLGAAAAVAAAVGVAGVTAAAAQDAPAPPAVQRAFEPFQASLKFRTDADYFYVESNGLPDHRMMVGIRAWQQQVPLPQKYAGANAWQIPLRPKVAAKPVSAKSALFRGAIALAVNGVPIFNPIKNDGRTDTFLAGELDEFGGHCGKGDDYHYHVAPVHLEKVVGKGNPIGYALDGYPLYGYTDSTGKEPTDLDEFNGRTEAGGYRYYSTRKYPYVNGGLRGEVTVRGDQVDPQPRATSPRPEGLPLRGAKITGFAADGDSRTLTYDLNGKPHSVRYAPAAGGGWTFVFTDGDGKQTTETYTERKGKGGKDGPPPKKKDDPPPKKGDNPPPPRRDDGPPPKAEVAPPPAAKGGLTLTSPAFAAGGKYPVEFTGDGAGVSPPLKWSGAPAGTKCFALSLWHRPKGDPTEVKSYWVVSHIPADVTALEKAVKGVGRVGLNDKKQAGYDPMKSKGPGVKEYHITLYALSAEPTLADRFTRADLLRAVRDITLAETTLTYTYERQPAPEARP